MSSDFLLYIARVLLLSLLDDWLSPVTRQCEWARGAILFWAASGPRAIFDDWQTLFPLALNTCGQTRLDGITFLDDRRLVFENTLKNC